MRLARQPLLMPVCWEQEQPDDKAVTSSTSEVVSEIALNPEVMEIPPAPEESGYQSVAALVGSSATRTKWWADSRIGTVKSASVRRNLRGRPSLIFHNQTSGSRRRSTGMFMDVIARSWVV